MEKDNNKTNNKSIVPIEFIEKRIYLIRTKKVMLDIDLAKLYNVDTKVLKQAVRRNIRRFPEDFMFELSWDEINSLRSQIVTLKNDTNDKSKRGKHTKYQSFVFTEQGVAMLSSVLRSERAIQVNIQIMRVFTKMRQMLLSHKELRRKIEGMEKRYDNNFRIVFDAIKKIIEVKEKPKRKIGF